MYIGFYSDMFFCDKLDNTKFKVAEALQNIWQPFCDLELKGR